MNPSRPKYQVFVSSTYRDLHEERERVLWAVLNSRHIPAGMENFTATSDRGWETISRVIDLSDYYVVILSGMYGTIDESTGVSWTEREYQYAVSRAVPVLGFVRDDSHITQDKAEADPIKRAKLTAFKGVLRQTHMVQGWTDGADLARKVVDALRNHIADDEDAGRARPGWYRGDKIVLPGNVAPELARLSSENEAMRRQIAQLTSLGGVALEVVSSSGGSVAGGIRIIATRCLVSRGARGRDSSTFGMLSSPSSGEFAEYTERINRSVLVELSIQNSGHKPARDVVIDLHLDRCAAVELALPDPPSALSVMAIAHAGVDWKTDPKEHVYIDHYRAAGGAATVRQRVKTIVPGVRESLVPFWVTTSGDGVSDWTVDCAYCAADTSGATVKGSVQIGVHFAAEEPVSAVREVNQLIPLRRVEVLEQPTEVDKGGLE